MANAIYPKWKEAALQATASASLSGSGATGVYAVLVDTSAYTYDAAHEFYSDLAGVVGPSVELSAGKTYTGGLFDADDIVLPAVTGSSVEALVLFIKTAGANTTWRLFAYLDTDVGGLPFTPSGGDVTITWNASGIAQL